MAKRRYPVEMTIDSREISVKKILKQGKGAPYEHRIAAIAILKNTINKLTGDLAQLKGLYENVYDDITTTDYETIAADLRGKIASTGSYVPSDATPVLKIIEKDGTILTASLKSGKDDRFEVDGSLGAKATLDMIPDKYKKVNITLDKKVIETDFNSGDLPEMLKRFCSKDSIPTTKITIKIDSSAVVDTEEDLE